MGKSKTIHATGIMGVSIEASVRLHITIEKLATDIANSPECSDLTSATIAEMIHAALPNKHKIALYIDAQRKAQPNATHTD